MGEQGAGVLPEGEVSLETVDLRRDRGFGESLGLWPFMLVGRQDSSLLRVLSGDNTPFNLRASALGVVLQLPSSAWKPNACLGWKTP